MVDGQTLGVAGWTGDRARRWLPLGPMEDLQRLYLPLILQEWETRTAAPEPQEAPVTDVEQEETPAAHPPLRQWLPVILGRENSE